MKYLDVTLEMPAWARHPMQEFCRRSDAMGRIELITWNVTGDGEEYAFFHIEGDVDAYRNRIDAVETVLEYNLTPVDESSFYSYVVQRTRDAERQWRRSFANRNLVVVPPIVYDEDVRMTLTVVGDADDLRAMLEDLPDDFEVAVNEVGDYDRRHATVLGGLTERQLTALEVAVALGYYAVPREATLEAVAAELGCAESTASNHLRTAKSRVMRRLVGGVARPKDGSR